MDSTISYRTPQTRQWLRWFLSVALTVVLLDAFLVAAYTWRLRAFAAREALASPRTSDAAVVFFGGLDDAGQLDGHTTARVATAAALFHAGRVRRVWTVGGARPEWRQPGARLMADQLRGLGVPDSLLAADNTSFDSHSNWRSARVLADRSGARSLVLVSSREHLYRLHRIARDTALRISVAPSPVPPSAPGSWWVIVHREMLALLAGAVLPRHWYDRAVRRLRIGAGA